MTQVVLIRPGSTDYDVQGRIQGNLDIPLNEDGRLQAAAAIECLKGKSLLALYSSCCRAAQETAQIIGEALSLKPKPLDRLQNLNHGLWQGMLIEEVKRKQPKVYKQWQEHPENVCPPEGERVAVAAQRVEVVLAKLLRKHRFGAFGLVAPEPLASMIRNRLQGGQLGDLWKAANGCSRIEVFQVQSNLQPSQPPHFQPPAVAEAVAINGNGNKETNVLATKAK